MVTLAIAIHNRRTARVAARRVPTSSTSQTLKFDTHSQSLQPSGLVVAEASLDQASRRIKGVVKNTSSTDYREVQISYYVQARGSSEGSFLATTIPGIRPNAAASFETDPLPGNARQFALRELVGTPR
jgi:hypothetical protein